jgi:Tfp pilus assembly protein PilF
MVRSFVLLLSLMLFASVFAQKPQSSSSKNPVRGLHALVVGISQYQNKAIPVLQFPDKDARLFADFLQSDAGGSIPDENLTLLLNENATFSAIYQAMFALMNRVQKNDTIYFYFSGHGDVENQTVFNLGYLLGYDSPPNNYINHAVRLEDINNFANTLSSKQNAKVILITDACRSGKLAGDIIDADAGLSVEHLLLTERNEIRLASCGPEELSVENQGWGGGREEFLAIIFCLGLQGGAMAVTGSKVVSGQHIQTFLNESFKTDRILLRDGHKQTPVITGNLSIPLSVPTEQSLAQVKQSQASTSKMPSGLAAFSSARELPLSPQAYVVGQIKFRGIDKIIDFRNPVTTPPQQFSFRLLDAVGSSDDPFGPQDERITKFRGMLRSDVNALLRFNEQIAQLICEKGQEAIAQYLRSDWIALEERQYYNTNNGDFLRYIHMYQYALQLIPKDHFLFRTLQTDYYYFLGTYNRMMQLINPEDKSLLNTAKQSLHLALQTEPYAPYVHNELANVFLRLRNQDSALHHYKFAAELSPTWAIPLANLVGLYYLKGDLTLAREISGKALALQPTLFNLLVNTGLVEEALKNRLHALELYQQAIKQNASHYLPYERLGILHAGMAQYAKADSFFYVSQNKKLGYDFASERDIPILAFGAGPLYLDPDSAGCTFSENNALNSFLPYQLVMGYNALQNADYPLAEKYLKEAHRIGGHRFFLPNHYLGLAYYKQGKMALAAHHFAKSIEQHRDTASFDEFLNNARLGYKGSEDISCFMYGLKQIDYPLMEDYYLLADVYDQLGYYDHAVSVYEKIINTEKSISFYQGWYLLAELHEKYAMWEAAEKTWFRYYEALSSMPREKCFDMLYEFSFQKVELQQFYVRVLKAYPAHAGWYRKAAEFFFDRYKQRYEEDWADDPDVAGSEFGMYENIYVNKRSAYFNCFRNITPTPGTQRKIQHEMVISFPYRTGMEIFSKALELNTQEEILQKLYIKHAEYLSFSGRQQQTVEALTHALEVSPENYSLRNSVIELLKRNSQFYQAYLQMDALKAKSKLLPNYYFEYAKLAGLAGNFQSSKSTLTEMAELFPDAEMQIDCLDKLTWIYLKEIIKAVMQHLQKKVKASPDDYNHWYGLVRMYAASKQNKEAVASYENCIKKWISLW